MSGGVNRCRSTFKDLVKGHMGTITETITKARQMTVVNGDRETPSLCKVWIPLTFQCGELLVPRWAFQNHMIWHASWASIASSLHASFVQTAIVRRPVLWCPVASWWKSPKSYKPHSWRVGEMGGMRRKSKAVLRHASNKIKTSGMIGCMIINFCQHMMMSPKVTKEFLTFFLFGNYFGNHPHTRIIIK